MISLCNLSKINGLYYYENKLFTGISINENECVTYTKLDLNIVQYYGPALYFINNGELNSESFPSVIITVLNQSINYSINNPCSEIQKLDNPKYIFAYYKNNVFHKENGPAIDGLIRSWYFHGKNTKVSSQEEFEKYLKLRIFE